MTFITARLRCGVNALTKLMYASSAVLAAGITMWLSGALVDIDSIEHATETISYGERLKVHARLDPRTDPHGVYVVRVERLLEGAIEVRVIDPLGHRLVDMNLDAFSVDDRFQVGAAGTYTLVIVNNAGPDSVTGAIGPSHGEFRLWVSEIGFVTMLAGICATVVCSAVLIRKLLF